MDTKTPTNPKMKKLLLLFPVFLLISCAAPFAKYEEAAKSWEPEIRQLEARDKTEKHPDNAILFIGSSSIRLWDKIEDNMVPFPVIQRGYGGAKFSDLIFYTERLVYPHNFRALVVFVANDIANTPEDKTPQEILKLYKGVVKSVRAKYPKKPIFLIEITPTNSRWEVWEQTQKANALLKKHCESTYDLYFIETASSFLGTNGKPKKELFREDQLHLTQQGYDIWAGLIKQRLQQVLGDI